VNKDLPEHIVIITYRGKSLEKEKKKLDEPVLQSCTRFLYVYGHEDLNERMAKAWREEAEAKVYSASYKQSHSVKASIKRGIWE
jgi:hypothetical protein